VRRARSRHDAQLGKPRRSEGGVLAAVLALALVLAACGGGDDEVAGGAADLPGPAPEGVVYATPPESALPAPDFSAELVDGTSVRASELWAKRPVVLVFTASWCERCADLHRAVADAVDEHGDEIALLGIVPEDDAEAARDYADELDLGKPLAAAPERVWLNYAAREPPVVVLVSRGGKVVRGWAGDVDREVLERGLGELAGSAG
jgi:peroxiredoxin